MRTLFVLIKRNMRLYFKDKGMFLVSLITPVILLVLYATFLGNVFKSSFESSVPPGLIVDQTMINGLIGGQLISSVLATCCVTIAFCSNGVMIQDKYTGSIKDLTIAPVKKSVLALSYFIGSLLSTLLVCYLTTFLCFIYLAIVGWYLTVADVMFILLDVFVLSLFGTSLSSLIHFFLKSQGQSSAVGTIVSSLYGFVCGAYMPMSQFPDGLRTVLGFLPGTYGTVLLRDHAMGTVISKFTFPDDVKMGIRDSIDANIYFFDYLVSNGAMYGILLGSIAVLLTAYILVNYFKKHNINR